MLDYGQRIVIDRAFDRALGAIVEAVRDEGLELIASVDVREHFRRTVGHDFRRYALIEVWSPELAFEALQSELQAGTIVATTLAIYELTDGETALVVRQALASVVDESGGECDTTDLRRVVDRDRERIARALARLRHVPRRKEAPARAA